MEWVHCHIARRPVSPAELLKDVPRSVSEIIVKLLAKTAEDRYQTAAGLERDLRRCLAQWEAERRIDPFPLGEQDRPASELFASYTKYAESGEINSTVDDQAAVVAKIESIYAGREAVTIDHLDGLTVDARVWWFNVRASNTEPLLRLNVEAEDEATMESVRDEVLSLITGVPVPAE